MILRDLSTSSWISSPWFARDAVESSRRNVWANYASSREFSHTIKHLTLATWTKEEVDLVTSGGNKVCRVCSV